MTRVAQPWRLGNALQLPTGAFAPKTSLAALMIKEGYPRRFTLKKRFSILKLIGHPADKDL